MGIKSLIVSIFIDDIKIMRVKDLRIIQEVKRKLTTAFEIVDIGPISSYLVLKIQRDCKKKTLKFL